MALDMEVMVIMATMARERLSQLPLLKLMLSQDIIILGMDSLMVDTAITVTMAREKQRPPLDTIIMDILMVVVAMDTMDTMERGRLMLSQGTITMVMAMDMVDMDTMVTMAREKLSQD